MWKTGGVELTEEITEQRPKEKNAAKCENGSGCY